MSPTDDLNYDDADLVVSLACSLDMHPDKKNWVEKSGGLPEYICQIAKAVKRSGGHDTSSAIAIAVGRVKLWAAGKGVDAKTQAKASAAVAQWEKLKAKSHSDNVKLSGTDIYELTFNRLYDARDLPVSDKALALAASFEDCSTVGALDNIIGLSRPQKNFVELAALTAKKRKNLDDSDFAIPEKRQYPIHDEAHARNALARVAQHGTPEEKKKVRAAVKRKHPNIDTGDEKD